MRAALVFAVLAPFAAAAPEDPYDGKYADDPRLGALRERLVEPESLARRRVERALGRKVDWRYELRLRDAGADDSGRRAETTGGRAGCIVVLKLEFLMLGTDDPERLLAHEFYHVVQRTHLGAARHARTPAWAREGAALYVADQFPARARRLAALAGGDPARADPLARLVDGLDGPHGLFDYAESAAAFYAARERHGAARTRDLLRALLRRPDARRAVHETLGESWTTFAQESRAYARRILEPLVRRGRAEFLALRMALDEGRLDDAVALGPAPGVYAVDATLLLADALEKGGRGPEAAALARKVSLRVTNYPARLVRLLARLGVADDWDPERDLAPFSARPAGK